MNNTVDPAPSAKIWRKTARGFTATVAGNRYSLDRYRRSDGGTAYVLRVNGSALESPARAFGTLAEAKAAVRALIRADASTGGETE